LKRRSIWVLSRFSDKMERTNRKAKRRWVQTDGFVIS